MKLKDRILRAEQIALRLVRTWWRPVTCIGIAAGTIINLVVIPLLTMKVPSLSEGALWIGACTAAFGVRAFEKVQGAAE